MNTLLINTLPLLARQTGVARYIRGICENWPADSPLERVYHYGYHTTRYRTGRPKHPVYTDDIKKSLHSSPRIRQLLKDILRWYGRIHPRKFDVYWEPNFIPLDHIKRRLTAMTVHDISFHDHPEWHPADRIQYYRRDFYPRVGQCDLILTDSDFSRSRIISALSIPKDRVQAVYPGVDGSLFNSIAKEELAAHRRRMNLPDAFVLSVGSLEPRKNITTLIHAHQQLAQSLRNQYPLVIAGAPGWGNASIMKLIQHYHSSIVHLGFTSDQDLAVLYNAASALVYPSHYEGFGLPPLEAMACGTPVIVSAIPAHRESCGTAALMSEPDDVDAFSRHMTRLLSDPALAADLSTKGRAHAIRFTWERAAAQHSLAFQDLMKR